jgi:hypothetical protein
MLTCSLHYTHALLHGLLRRSFLILTPNHALISSVGVLSPSWGMLYYMLDVQLFLQPQAVRQSTHRVPSSRGYIWRPNTQLTNNSYYDNDGETADSPHRTQNPVTTVTTIRVWFTHVVLQRDFLNAELNIAELRPPSFAVLQLMSSALRRAVTR